LREHNCFGAPLARRARCIAAGCASRCRAALLGLLLLLAGNAWAAPADIAPGGVLRAAFLGSNPVQGHVDPRTGEITGVVADLVKELARRLGVPYEIYPAANAADIVNRLNTRQSDIGFIAYDPQRGREVDFSSSYALMYNALVVRADSPIQATAAVDQPGVTIAAVRGQTQQIVLSATIKQGKVLVLEKKPGQAELEALLGGRQVDAYGANRQDAEQIAAASSGKLRALPDNFLVVEQAIVTAKGESAKLAELDKFIADVRASGFVQQALDRTRIAGLAVATGTHR
jgi:polar amino acid transport system substrate-binding protein